MSPELKREKIEFPKLEPDASSVRDEVQLCEQGVEIARAKGIDLDLLESPPNMALTTSVVIPVRNEFASGYLVDIVERFAKQRAPKENFEIIFGVNNTRSDIDQESPAVADNQQGLAFLRAISDPTVELPEDFPNRAREVVKRARETRLSVGVIDLATTGLSEVNMGKVRDLLSNVAIARFDKVEVGDLGVVHFLDADAPIGRNFINRLTEEFENDSVDTVFSTVNTSPVGAKEVFQTTEATSWLDLRYSLSTLCEEADHAERVNFGGPLISARAGVLKEVSGVPHWERGEDVMLHLNLSQRGGYRVADTGVVLSDRAKRDGFISQQRLENIENGIIRNAHSADEVDQVHPKYELLIEELSRKLDCDPRGVRLADVQKAFARHNLPSDRETLQAHGIIDEQDRLKLGFAFSGPLLEYAKESGVSHDVTVGQYGELYYKTVRELISESPEAVELLDKAVHSQVLKEAVRHGHSNSLFERALDRAYKNKRGQALTLDDFSDEPLVEKAIERQPWMLEELNAVRGEFRLKRNARKELQSRFPDQLKPFSEAGARRSRAHLQGVTNFLRSMKAQSDDYPVAARALRTAGFRAIPTPLLR